MTEFPILKIQRRCTLEIEISRGALAVEIAQIQPFPSPTFSTFSISNILQHFQHSSALKIPRIQHFQDLAFPTQGLTNS